MVLGTRDTLPPEPFCARQNYIDIIARQKRVLNSSRLVEGHSSSKITLFTKEDNPGEGDKTCPCKQFALASKDNFSNPSMCNRTKKEYFHVLCLCHFII